MLTFKTGLSSYRPVDEASLDELKRSLAVHVHGTFLITSLISAAMKSQELVTVDSAHPERGGTRGSIVVLGSSASIFAIPHLVPYTASKHAVLAIAKTAGKRHDRTTPFICPTF